LNIDAFFRIMRILVLMKRALIVIAQSGYQDHELEGTVNGLSAGGFEITICSKEEGACQGKLGGSQEATIAMRDADTADFETIAFIGGPGARALAQDEDALDLASRFSLRKKPMGAICIAPTILAAAGLLRGKRATVWNEDGEQAQKIIDGGGEYTGEAVTVDGLLVTGNGPKAAEEFGKRLAEISRS
jgi:protease I